MRDFVEGDKIECISVPLGLCKGSWNIGNVYTFQRYYGSFTDPRSQVGVKEIPDTTYSYRFQLVQETSPWFGKKYRVTPETSELLQKEVFKAGGYWEGDSSKCLHYTSSPMLYIMPNGRLYHLTKELEEEFEESTMPEGIIEVEKMIRLSNVIDPISQEQLEYNKLQEQIKQLQIQAEKLKPKGVK